MADGSLVRMLELLSSSLLRVQDFLVPRLGRRSVGALGWTNTLPVKTQREDEGTDQEVMRFYSAMAVR